MNGANLQSIAITNGVSLVLLFILLIVSNMSRERRRLEDRIFTALIIICAGACICETASWFSDGVNATWAVVVNYAANTYCYLTTCIYAYLWILYVDAHLHKGAERFRSLYPWLLVPVIVAALAVIGNLFGGYFFIIDADNVYHRQPAGYICYALAFFLLFFSIYLKHSFEKRHGKVRFFPIYMFLIPVFVGAIIQSFAFGVSIAWTSVAIALVSIHMSQQNELSYIDTLTNLYNRTFLDHLFKAMQHNKSRGSGIMVDLDYFKNINDTYGHTEGDKALISVASILTKCAPADCLIIRYAGDEFVVLMEREVEQCELYAQAVKDALSAFNEQSDKPYKLQLSMGYAQFDLANDDIDTFFKLIDERMYENKRRHHEAASNPER